MKVLVTGGLGGIGRHLCKLLLEAGIDVTIYHRFPTKSLKYAWWFPRKRIVWGDMRDLYLKRDLLAAQDAVIHLAYVLPPDTETHPIKARETNVIATERLLHALEEVNPACRFIFPSSVTTYGITKSEVPPLTINHPLAPNLEYGHHKMACEEIIRTSPLPWILLRVAEAPYLEVAPSPRHIAQVYEIPWDQRVEFVHIKDVAQALCNSLFTDHVRETFIVAGGSCCQMTMYAQMAPIFRVFHLPPPPKHKFSMHPYPLDWYNTEYSQEVLQYQSRTFEQYVADVKKAVGWKTRFFWLVSPFARLYLKWSRPAPDRRKSKFLRDSEGLQEGESEKTIAPITITLADH